VITSPTGAAIRDIIRILGRRFPFAEVVLFPAQVQGTGAAATMIAGLRYFADARNADVIILGRGGGSAEDLWEFNDEDLARAVAASPIPVISAVGHESDFTICDFVADVRAATPSAAAELAVPDSAELVRRFRNVTDRMALLCKRKITSERERLSGLSSRRIFSDPTGLYREKHLRLDALSSSLEHTACAKLRLMQTDLSVFAGKLNALNPLAILARGYAVASVDGRVVKRVADIAEDQSFRLRLSDGEISAKRMDKAKE
jgi:exodeoxyribonuclease VII large subunit